MEVFALVMTVTSMMMSAYAQQVAAKQAAAAAEFQQDQANRQAEDAARVGEVQAEKAAINSNVFRSMQWNEFGSANVRPDVGAPLAVYEESSAYGALDVLNETTNAARAQWSAKNTAAGFGLRANSAKQAGLISTGATVAGGLYSISGQIGKTKDESGQWKWHLGNKPGRG